jgi:hypothetical protein
MKRKQIVKFKSSDIKKAMPKFGHGFYLIIDTYLLDGYTAVSPNSSSIRSS